MEKEVTKVSEKHFRIAVGIIKGGVFDESSFWMVIQADIDGINEDISLNPLQADEKRLSIFAAYWKAVRLGFDVYPAICQEIITTLFNSKVNASPTVLMQKYFSSQQKHSKGRAVTLDEILAFKPKQSWWQWFLVNIRLKKEK